MGKGIPALNFCCDGEGMDEKNECFDLKSVIEITKIYTLTAFDFLRT